jgi:4-hydroxy-3-methylbut-2-en-1-yl diphosphate reductase
MRQQHRISQPEGHGRDDSLPAFSSSLIDRIRSEGNVWSLPGGQVMLPEVFGFCQGVKRALRMLQQAVSDHPGGQRAGTGEVPGPAGGRLFLLGQIIHNPWVNRYFEDRGVRVLSPQQVQEVQQHVGPGDCAVIPAFGVSLPVERRLRQIGCRIVDTSCGDVRRLWTWAEQAAGKGYGLLIFGRADHDETMVTKSRLADAGRRYLVVGNLQRAGVFCDLVTGRLAAGEFRRHFDEAGTNAADLVAFQRLAQVSQTTMLYDETIALRDLLLRAYAERFGPEGLDQRLVFQPTVCRATQARQAAAVALCQRGCDLVVVVGGFGSSNTRHLYELARSYAPAWFIEDAPAIRSERELATVELPGGRPVVAENWLPPRRPLRIGVLAGASSPEIVVGEVVQRLGELLG